MIEPGTEVYVLFDNEDSEPLPLAALTSFEEMAALRKEVVDESGYDFIDWMVVKIDPDASTALKRIQGERE